MKKHDRLHIGTSGWNYEDWKGIFYPEDSSPNEWFQIFSQHFETVELNNTFYQLPGDETFKKWQKQASHDFIYAVKANRYLTHMKKLNEPEEPLEIFLSGARLLEANLGPLLYQLPPRWHQNLERLEHFLKILPDDLDHVFEFRDPTWLNKETLTLLEKYKANFCIFDLSEISCPIEVTGKIAYLRFHGPGKKYESRYSDEVLQEWAQRITQWLDQDYSVFAYFNNDYHGNAIENAKTLIEMVQV